MYEKRNPKSLKRVGNTKFKQYEKFKKNQPTEDENDSGWSYLQRRTALPHRRKMEMYAL